MGFAFRAVGEDEAGGADARHRSRAPTSSPPSRIGTALAGLAGGLYTFFTQFITPDAFDFIFSVMLMAMVVIGGVGSTCGVVAAAIGLTLLPEAIRFVNDYRLLVFGGLLVLVIRLAPGGLAGLARAAVAASEADMSAALRARRRGDPLRRRAGGRRRLADGRDRRICRAHRPERRRQDHADPYRRRRAEARPRTRLSRRRGRHPSADADARAHGPGADASDRAAVPRDDGAGQCRARGGLSHTSSPLRALLQVDRRARRKGAAEILARVGLAGAERKLAGALPLGQMKRLEVARALALDPKIILLDEPLAGLNHAEASKQIEMIAEVHASGVTIALVEHNLEEVMRVCRRLVVLAQRRGHRRRQVRTSVMADPVVREAYIGTERAIMLRLESLACGYGAVEAVARPQSRGRRAAQCLRCLGRTARARRPRSWRSWGMSTSMRGRILLDGVDITRRRADGRASTSASRSCPEGRQLFSDLTVEENLTVGGYAASASATRRAIATACFGYFPRLARPARARSPGSLSGGEQQMLAIGRALMAEPRLLLIDELSLGLMPKMVDLCLDALLR